METHPSVEGQEQRSSRKGTQYTAGATFDFCHFLAACSSVEKVEFIQLGALLHKFLNKQLNKQIMQFKMTTMYASKG